MDDIIFIILIVIAIGLFILCFYYKGRAVEFEKINEENIAQIMSKNSEMASLALEIDELEEENKNLIKLSGELNKKNKELTAIINGDITIDGGSSELPKDKE